MLLTSKYKPQRQYVKYKRSLEYYYLEYYVDSCLRATPIWGLNYSCSASNHHSL